MAKRVVEESSLVSVANAIRERAGTNSKLVFPQGWEDTVKGISSGADLPKLNSPGSAADLVLNKELVDGYGNKITGSMQPLGANGTVASSTAEISEKNGAKTLTLMGNTANVENEYVKPSASIAVTLRDDSEKMAVFGDAGVADVVAGKIFTSKDGFALTGIGSAGGVTPTGTINITSNGSHNVASYAMAKVDVTPNLTSGKFTPKKSTSTYFVGGNYDGYSSVTVEGDDDLIPANIKKDVEIFGVTGTLDGADFDVDELSELHAWYKRRTAGTVTEAQVTDLVLCQSTDVSTLQKVDYADSYEIVNNAISLVNPINHTLTQNTSKLNAIKGKYIYAYYTQKYYYIPSDANVNYQSATLSAKVTVDVATQLTYTGADGELAGIVVSDTSTAYPHNGSQGGYMYEYIGILGEQVSDPVLQLLTVEPRLYQQVFEPGEGYDGYSKVTVNAIKTTTRAKPTISVTDSGTITAAVSQTTGYVEYGIETASKQLTTMDYELIVPGRDNIVAVPAGTYTTGNIVVEGDGNLVPAHIRKGITIFGVTGELEEATGPTISFANGVLSIR